MSDTTLTPDPYVGKFVEVNWSVAIAINPDLALTGAGHLKHDRTICFCVERRPGAFYVVMLNNNTQAVIADDAIKPFTKAPADPHEAYAAFARTQNQLSALMHAAQDLYKVCVLDADSAIFEIDQAWGKLATAIGRDNAADLAAIAEKYNEEGTNPNANG